MQGSPPSKVKEMSTRLERSCASQKVLSLPELVILTINDLAVEDLHSASLVCRTWSEIALDHLWRTAVSLAPLLNTLASMQYSKEESNWTFAKDLDRADWVRFHAYALRIRVVEIRTPLKQWSHPVSNDSLKIVQESMPPWCHFPKPTGILCEAVATDFVAPLLRNSLYVVSTSMRELQVREFNHMHVSWNTVHSPVHELFRRIGELDIPCLESLSFRHASYSSDPPSFPPLIKRHASTLSTLNLFIPFNEELWIAVQDLHNLQRFSVNLILACCSRSNPRDTLTTLDGLTSGLLRRLEEFTVTLPSSDIRTEPRRLAVFRCIGRMTQLKSLTMTSCIPIMPHANEMWSMGRDMCQLETLRIDTGWLPIGEGNIDTTSYLILILQIFPHLKRLDTSLLCKSVPSIVHTEARSLLEILDVSGSPAPKAKLEDVAVFLRSVLPRGARVVYAEVKSMTAIYGGKAAWGEIARLVNLA